ncbi:hypothetical protein ONE63_007331 [Megalurothrips usitatus]|uniref:HAT C-terminal dimerisation domain-containing protein n=1 Tax=Megalurothrips usitatus TaxID=439358 RepID=A0AAV7XST8_9NEOP|nr:hypothetical protein ONE63_007331 [Megalurothrips usitatus]
MPKLCETRFIERHDTYLMFRDKLPDIIQVLQEIMEWKEAKAASDAQALILSLTNPSFIVTLACMCDIFSTTLPLANMLQKPSLDVVSASDHVKDVINTLDEKRRQADEVFGVLFMESQEMLEKLGGEMKVPPRVFRRGRSGHPGNENPETYFRQAIFIPILDSICEDIKERFSKDTLDAYGLTVLLPKVVASPSLTPTQRDDQTRAIVTKYWDLFSTSERSFQQTLLGELNLWQRKWVRSASSDLPKDVAATAEACDATMFPVINGLLRILASLPSSTCSAERSFSTLKRLKTYLRNTMTGDRLTGLALLNIHRDIIVNTQNVLERFLKGPRRMV